MSDERGIPERIYLQHDPEDSGVPFTEAYGVTWCQDRINKTDIEYVRTDAHCEQPDLRGALEPFAALDIRHRSDMTRLENQDDKPVFALNNSVITLGDIRKAQAALAAPKDNQG